MHLDIEENPQQLWNYKLGKLICQLCESMLVVCKLYKKGKQEYNFTLIASK